MLIEHHLPAFDVVERHRAVVAADAARAWAALMDVDLRRSAVISLLLGVRGLRGDATVAGFQRLGFQLLEEEPGRQMVLGLVGKPWRSRPLVRRDADFASFAEPGYVKIAWAWVVEPQGEHRCVVSTETRVRATNPRARRLFWIYWHVIGRLSGLIRSRALVLIKRAAERG